MVGEKLYTKPFIIQGQDTSILPLLHQVNFLHMNWGWNGTGMGSNNNNGWFKYNDFQIDGVIIKGTNADFQYKKRMIIGIKPN